MRIAPLKTYELSRYGMPTTAGDLDHAWSRCRKWLKDALDQSGNTHSIDDVYNKVLAGEAFFIPGAKSALVVEIIWYPLKSVLNFWLAGGDIKELYGLEKEATNFGKSLGIYDQQFSGRLGWDDIAKAHGWRKTQVLWHRNVRN